MNAYRNWEMDTDEVSELASYLDDGGPYSSFLTCGLAQIFTDRTGEDFDWHITQRILDSVEGGDDPCTHSFLGQTLRKGIFSMNSSLIGTQCQSTNDFCIGRFLKNESCECRTTVLNSANSKLLLLLISLGRYDTYPYSPRFL